MTNRRSEIYENGIRRYVNANLCLNRGHYRSRMQRFTTVRCLMLAMGLLAVFLTGLPAFAEEYPSTGYALKFPGEEGSYLDLGNLDGAVFDGEFTFETWILVETHPQTPNRPIFELKKGDENLVRLLQARRGWSNNITLDIYGGKKRSGTKKAGLLDIINLGQWHHLAVTVKAGEDVRFYVDGEDATRSRDIPGGFTFSDFSSARIGELFHGELTEIRLWNRYRSQAQIQDDMNRTLPESSDNLVGYWPLREESGDTVEDASGHNRDGTLAGAVEWVLVDPIANDDNVAVGWSSDVRKSELLSLEWQNAGPILINAVQRGPTPATRIEALNILKKRDIPAAELIPLWTELVKDKEVSEAVRRKALNVISENADSVGKNVASTVAGVLREDSYTLRRLAFRTLVSIGTESIPALRKELTENSNASVRAGIITVMEIIKPDFAKVASELQRAAENDPDPYVRKRAVHVLNVLGSED